MCNRLRTYVCVVAMCGCVVREGDCVCALVNPVYVLYVISLLLMDTHTHSLAIFMERIVHSSCHKSSGSSVKETTCISFYSSLHQM